MFDALLQTKLLIPTVQSSHVVRQRLVDKLNQGTTRRLCLVSAPAGYGKTALVAAWARQGQRPVAWISLDRGDNEPTRFLAYLLAVLQALRSSPEKTALASPQRQLPILDEAVLTHLVNEIARYSTPFSLILDDYHSITELCIHEAVTFILDNMPPNMNLMIISRQDPPLSLSRLRAREQIVEIRQADLQFTLDEAAAFLRTHTSLSLAETDVMALVARTEGWAVGLQLAAITLQSAQAESHQVEAHRLTQSITGNSRFILDYLVEEVLTKQPAIIHDFLLQTSILDRLSGPLCDAVLEIETWRSEHQVPAHILAVFQVPITSRQILEYLERLNLFIIPLDDVRQWYRYHSLLAELLQQQLEQKSDKQAVASLHRRSSQWYEENDMPFEAIEHALAARDYPRTARLVEVHGQRALWEHSHYVTVTNWLNALPDHLIASNPKLAILHAMGLGLTGQLPSAEKRLQIAEQIMVTLPADQQQTLIGQIIVARSYMTAFYSLEEHSVEWLERALAQIPLEDANSRGSMMAMLGNAYRLHGKIDLARQTLTKAIQLCQQVGNVVVVVMATNMLSAVERAQGRLGQALARCRRAQEISDQTLANEPSLMGTTLLALAEIQYQRNELDESLDTLTRGIQLTLKSDTIIRQHAQTGHVTLARIRQGQGDYQAAEQALMQAQSADSTPQMIALFAAQRAWLDLARGNIAAAKQWTDRVTLTAERFATHALDEEIITLARVRIVQGKPEEALGLLEKVRATAEADGRLGDMLQIAVLQALAFQADGNMPAALDAITVALVHGKAEGYVRLFIDEGPTIALLLRQAARAGIVLDYTAQLLAAFPIRGQPSATITESQLTQPLLEPLSTRELEVLSLMAAGYSNPEIARELIVSVGTVKTHTHHIYSKLNARNRAEAVRRAKELKLI